MWQFISNEEQALANEYAEKGFIIRPVANKDALAKITATIRKAISDFLKIADHEDLLNQIGGHLTPEKLNEARLHVYDVLNSNDWLRAAYFSLAKETLDVLVGNELVMQRRVNLSIQLPDDDSSLLPVHADVWSGDSPYEVVVWLPLVDCFESKAMYLLPPQGNQKLLEKMSRAEPLTAEQLFNHIESDIQWIKIPHGQVLVFNQTLAHGNRVNKETTTRWSLNCRFKSVFSPYSDKKLGEFFEPITLRAATRQGLTYQFPEKEDADD
jgi:sporadic carbohydrate cluster 2OG-Fe(II) oxygenase